MRVVDGRLRLSSLEYFLGDRCNLRCEHCSASSPYLRDPNLPEIDRFRRELALLEPVLRSAQIKFVGGEPLLNRSVCDFLRVARESGIFGGVRVATNGVLLPRMRDEFWDLADVVEISRYPGVEQPDGAALAALAERARDHGTLLEINEIERFMVAVFDTPNEDRRQVEEIFRNCGEAHEWSCHVLHQGRLYRCSRVHTLDRYLSLRRVPHEPFTALDGVPIDDRPTLLEDLVAYLSSATPLNACRHCLGTSGRWAVNRQLRAAEARDRLSAPPQSFDPESVVGPGEAHIRRRTTTWPAAKELTDRV